MLDTIYAMCFCKVSVLEEFCTMEGKTVWVSECQRRQSSISLRGLNECFDSRPSVLLAHLHLLIGRVRTFCSVLGKKETMFAKCSPFAGLLPRWHQWLLLPLLSLLASVQVGCPDSREYRGPEWWPRAPPSGRTTLLNLSSECVWTVGGCPHSEKAFEAAG